MHIQVDVEVDKAAPLDFVWMSGTLEVLIPSTCGFSQSCGVCACAEMLSTDVNMMRILFIIYFLSH